MGEAKRRKIAGLGPRYSLRVNSAAVHEATHAVIGMHFGVPILEISVTREGSDAKGFTDSRWTELPKGTFSWRNNQIAILAGPLMEYMFLSHQSEDLKEHEVEAWLRSSRGDFADIQGREGVSLVQALEMGQLWLKIQEGADIDEMVSNAEAAGLLRKLMRDTKDLLAAYNPQISELANAILTAPGTRLDEAAVSEWRKHHFKRLDVEASQPDPPISSE